MATLPTITQILSTANLREYLSFNSNAKNAALKGGTLASGWPVLIDCVRKGVQNRYNISPSEFILPNQTSTYLFNIVAPLINVSLDLLTSNLSAVAVSSTRIDLSWVAVPHGQTYILESALDANFTIGLSTIFTGSGLSLQNTGLTPATHYFYRIHVTAPGYNPSPYAYADATTLSAPVLITVSYYYGSTDFFAALQGGTDAVPYVGSINITHNAPFTITWPAGAANNQFQVIRVPIGENIKTAFFNTPLNQGAIPGPEYQSPLQPVLLPLYTYYCSRTAISLDGSTLTETFS